MDLSLERESTAIASLFQQIIADMKNTSPLWEDFVTKACKLHACLRAAIQAIAAYLDAFQKIADAATNSRGASKEIGTALTRVCLRHKAVETRMKTFTSAIMDCLIIPLQDKLEDWKRQVATLDKEHAKEYKRCRTELKKRSSDTLRLQKKARKGQSETIQSLVDSHMHDVTMRRAELEEVEKKSLRAAMIEERMRYCSFVNMLQPVVKEECEVMSELSHLQEAMDSIANVTKEPNVLPQSSEELISETKTSINLYPESPGGGSGSQGCSNSLGSRKSSVCSISSMNSSGSSGSPGHHHYQRSLSQTSTNPSQTHAVSTWPPHSQDVPTTDRPHTISSAYEKGHQRPALTVYTFQNPETIMESQKSPATMSCRPPLPVRCSSLERPLSATGTRSNVNLIQRQCPSPIPAHITKELPQHQPTYVNMSELASMAALKITNQQLQQQQLPPKSNPSTQVHSDSLIAVNQRRQNVNSPPDLAIENTITSVIGATGVNPSSGSGGSPPTSSSRNNSSQFTNSSQTPLTSGSGDTANNLAIPAFTKESLIGGDDDELKIIETDCISTISTSSNNTATVNNLNNDSRPSTDNTDDVSRGSVLEKTSMFEKLEQKQLINNNLSTLASGRIHSTSSTNIDGIYGNRKDDNNKVGQQQQQQQQQSISDKETGCVTRIARRSSVNSTKPPPPVRRSSSVTPSHNLTMPNSPNLIQQNVLNISAENLPPPPAYLLDRTNNASPTKNVADTVKALTVIRHTPASPFAVRRAQNQINQTTTTQSNKQSNNTTAMPVNLSTVLNNQALYPSHTSQPSVPNITNTNSGSFNSSFRTQNSTPQSSIYAQPKQVTKMSSFRTPSPGPQKPNASLIAQLNARLTPNKHLQQTSQGNEYSSSSSSSSYNQNTYHDNRNQTQSAYSSSPNSPHHQSYGQSDQIYSKTADRYYYGSQQQQQQQQSQQPQQYDDYSPLNSEKSGSIKAKTKAEFLENLNAKLAKQGLSGRAFAVRNFINSKALPDPRLCHESLMDQIKRGAPLKRNRTINDRSAPKIH